jgi:dihydroorotate dehydrogenase electron transfer subunit
VETLGELGVIERADRSTLAPAPWREVEATLVANDRLPGKRHHYAVLEAPEDFPEPRPGQFVMLAPSPCPPGLLLRRPMSVTRSWREGGRRYLGFLYTVLGQGTQALARERGRWSVLGPMGSAYPPARGPHVLVAGGRGVAPLVLLAEECARRGEPVILLNGAKNAAEIVAPEELGAQALAEGSIALETTEDGSRGSLGRVLDLLERPLVRSAVREPGAAFYSCGPHGLLAAVSGAARELGVPAWVALEARMACGTGICRSCVVPRAPGAPVPAEASNQSFLLACLDGPVVDAGSVDWERAL